MELEQFSDSQWHLTDTSGYGYVIKANPAQDAFTIDALKIEALEVGTGMPSEVSHFCKVDFAIDLSSKWNISGSTIMYDADDALEWWSLSSAIYEIAEEQRAALE